MNAYVELICAEAVAPEKKAACPFCGQASWRVIGVDRGVEVVGTGRGIKQQVECINCGARGPIYGDKLSAKIGWQKGDPR